ncbi:MAG: DedA family protein [Patescibacteria group bacterium]|nr:MAG: DedA family protein [Patescibacteria group bacterium]
MGEAIASLVLLVRDITVTLGYPGVFLAAFLENFFPPLPSEVIFPFVGFVAGTGQLSLWGVILAGTLGTLAGAALWYGLGYVLGRSGLKVYIDRYGKVLRITFKDVERAEDWFARYEGPAVFIGRLVPLIRTLISIPAGMVRMSKGRFFLFTFLGSFLWIGFLSTAGFLLGERWEEISGLMEKYELWVGVLLTAATVVLIWRFYRDRLGRPARGEARRGRRGKI